MINNETKTKQIEEMALLKKFMKYIFLSTACVLLVACGGEESIDRYSIVAPDATGAFELSSVWGHETLESYKDNGKVSFAIGLRGNKPVAYAGMWPQTEVTPITTSSGSATLFGRYQVMFSEYLGREVSGGGSNRGIYVRDGDTEVIIPRGENTPTRTTGIWSHPKVSERKAFSATINFDDGTITGKSITDSSDLRINGTFNADGSVKGISSFRGVGGDLGGLVGADEVIGAVAGGSGNSFIYSGGFVVSDDTYVENGVIFIER